MRPQEIIDDEREHGRAFGPLADVCRLELARGAYCECVRPAAYPGDGGATWCHNCNRMIDFPDVLIEAIRVKADPSGRCALCGGPHPDGTGCEHCPRVD